MAYLMSTYTPLQQMLMNFVYAWMLKRPMGSVTKDMNVADCQAVIRHLKALTAPFSRFVGTVASAPEKYFWYGEVLSALFRRIEKGDD